MKLILVLVGLIAPSVAHAALTCAPPTLTKIVTHNITPGVSGDHWSGQPTVMYRLGSGKIRNEEPRDAAGKLHLTMVVNEPDIWFVNREDFTGAHIVDPGPTYGAHAPIINDPEAPAVFGELEYGCEADFVRDKRLSKAGVRSIEGRQATVHALIEGDRRLEIALADDGRPVEIGYFVGDRPLMILRYDEHRSGLADQGALFSKPEGFTYSEQRPTVP